MCLRFIRWDWATFQIDRSPSDVYLLTCIQLHGDTDTPEPSLMTPDPSERISVRPCQGHLAPVFKGEWKMFCVRKNIESTVSLQEAREWDGDYLGFGLR